MVDAAAPASSANLGPGFDTLAVALDLWCRVTAEPAEAWEVNHVGPHRPQPSETDLVKDVASAVVGPENPLRLEVSNDVPLASGLGSSSAVRVATAAAARRALSLEADRQTLFVEAAGWEGHPDNAAAAVWGGLVASSTTAVMPLHWHESLVPVIGLPNYRIPTKLARNELPPQIDRGVAVRTLGRVTALIEGLRTGDLDLLGRAAGDELHELPRSHMHPHFEEMARHAYRSGAGHVCWSGAGPAVLAITTEERREAVAASMRDVLGTSGSVLVTDVSKTGLV